MQVRASTLVQSPTKTHAFPGGKEARLVCGNPHLINYDCHHEQKITSKRPEHDKFGAFELPPGDVMLLCPNQLIVFERG
jgi:hypothetical protein